MKMKQAVVILTTVALSMTTAAHAADNTKPAISKPSLGQPGTAKPDGGKPTEPTSD